ncbi:MAG: hypothetical protein ACXVCH_04310 [Bdellovibrionota bacterium]
MNKTEAEKQIDEIFRVVHSGHRVITSPLGLMLSGGSCVVISGILWIGRLWQTGKIGVRSYESIALALMVLLFLLSFGGRRLIRRQEASRKSQAETIHPLIDQSLGAGRVLLLSALGLSIVWWAHTDRLMPVWAMAIGVLTNLWGRFVHRAVVFFSYVLIAAGIVFAALSELGLLTDDLIPLAILFFGFWMIGLGLVIKRYQGR